MLWICRARVLSAFQTIQTTRALKGGSIERRYRDNEGEGEEEGGREERNKAAKKIERKRGNVRNMRVCHAKESFRYGSADRRGAWEREREKDASKLQQ